MRQKAHPALLPLVLALLAAALLAGLGCAGTATVRDDRPAPGLEPPMSAPATTAAPARPEEAAKSVSAGTAPKDSAGGEAGTRGAWTPGPPAPEFMESTPSSGAPRPSASAPSQSGLKAGYSDDNAQFNLFLNFLRQYGEAVPHEELSVGERVVLKVEDVDGRPVAGARVTVAMDRQGSAVKDQALDSGRTYADGSFALYPLEYRSALEATAYRVTVDSPAGKASLVVERQGDRTLPVRLSGRRVIPSPLPVDILFVLDTTGSMGEEIERLRATIEIINANIAALRPVPAIRFGMVLYRDQGDDYVTQVVPFTGDLDSFQKSLDTVEAGGGGDTPEDLVAALDQAVRGMAWREGGLRLAFVVTDAPPHLDYGATYGYADAGRDARSRAIKFFTIGAGGLPLEGEYALRQVAQFTEGKYIFLTYGERGESEGGKEGSVSHHSGSNFTSDKLESVVIRFVKDEFARFQDAPAGPADAYLQADAAGDEARDETLAKLFGMAVQDLVDYSGWGLSPATRLAVMPILPAVEGGTAAEGLARQAEYFGEQLSLAASRSRLFTIVERKDLQQVLAELELQLSGIVDESQAARVGKMLGAEVLITGTIYRKDSRYEVFLRLVRVESAEILSATKARVDSRLGL